MHDESLRSHRLFMGLSSALSVLLFSALVMGWFRHVQEMEERQGRAAAESFEQREKARPVPPLPAPVAAEVATPAPQPAPPPAPATPKAEATEKAGEAVAKSPPPATPLVSLAGLAPNAGEKEQARPKANVGVPEPVEIETLELLQDSPDLVAAGQLLDKYMSAKTWQERTPYVWDSARVGQLMKRFYEEGGSDPVPQSLTSRGRYKIGATDVLYFSFASSRPNNALELVMRRGRVSEWLIDWESYIGIGDLSWAQLKKDRPTEPVLMRAYVKTGDYFNYEFSDSSRFLAVNIYDENGELVVYAYCDRLSDIAAFLSRDLDSTGQTMKGYTLKLAYPENAESSQCLWLKEVVAPRWLLE